MAQKVCKVCKVIYEEAECPFGHGSDSVDVFKGKVIIFSPEASEIATKLTYKQKGTYAIKLG